MRNYAIKTLICILVMAFWGRIALAESPKIETYLLKSASAAEDIAQPLTLDKCVKIALDHNPAIREAKEGVAVAREKTGEVTAAYYPTLSLNAGYARWEKYAFLPSGFTPPGGAATTIGPTDDWTAGLKARLLLFDSGERRAQRTSAIAWQAVAEQNAEKIRQDVALQVYQAYYSLRSAQRARSIATKNLSRTEDHLRLARKRKEAGAAPKVDVIRAQSKVAQAKMDIASMENLVRIARGRLNTAMGLPAKKRLEVANETEKISPPTDINLDEALKQAVQTRPILNAALNRVAAARSAVRAARSSYGPTLKAEGGYGYREPDFFPDDKEWSVGIFLDWPIFTGFSRKHKLSRTKSELSKKEAEVKRLIRQVQEEVWSAYSKLQKTYESIQTAEALVQDAQEGMRLARERYQTGSGPISDLLDTQTALAAAEAAQLSAQWDYLQAQALFRRSVGKIMAQTE